MFIIFLIGPMTQILIFLFYTDMLKKNWWIPLIQKYCIYNLTIVAKIRKTSKFSILLYQLYWYLFAFLNMVVQKKWFQEIIISYLPMGHTHKKVDRDLFATIENLKTIKNCEIPYKFPKFFTKSFKNCPDKLLFRMNPLFWDSHFGNNVRSIKNLSRFRAFMVKCDRVNLNFFTKKTFWN
jgi:hypothetical protein